MQDDNIPTLFGLKNTNRDFSTKADWGKNVFNNAFPASLLAYMHSKDLKPVYLKLTDSLEVAHDKISISEFFKANPLDEKLFYNFESLYLPYESLVSGTLPRIDLVICLLDDNAVIDETLRGIEIKLTAVPDNSTADYAEEDWGAEIVVRPDTIVYLALSIATNYSNDKERLAKLILPVSNSISDWNDAIEVSAKLNSICEALNKVLLDSLDKQEPLVLQPVWKTEGKTLELNDNAFDAFIWSDYGFTRLFVDNLQRTSSNEKVTRPMRTCVWLLKMLHDYAVDGKIHHSNIIRNISFGSQTDKAFAVSGRITRNYLRSDELLNPRVKSSQLNEIILFNGQKMLSPERRFDAAVLANPSLFE